MDIVESNGEAVKQSSASSQSQASSEVNIYPPPLRRTFRDRSSHSRFWLTYILYQFLCTSATGQRRENGHRIDRVEPAASQLGSAVLVERRPILGVVVSVGEFKPTKSHFILRASNDSNWLEHRDWRNRFLITRYIYLNQIYLVWSDAIVRIIYLSDLAKLRCTKYTFLSLLPQPFTRTHPPPPT